MKKLIAVVALSLPLLLVGCSLFSSPTPKSNVALSRAAFDGKKVVKDADTFEVPNEWAQESIVVDLEETFDTTTAPGQEVLKQRRVFISRNTDPKVAGNVAIVRATSTERFGKEGIKAAATLGVSAITGEGSGALAGLAALFGKQETKPESTTDILNALNDGTTTSSLVQAQLPPVKEIPTDDAATDATTAPSGPAPSGDAPTTATLARD